MSMLFRNIMTRVGTPVARRNIATTAVRKSSDPILGHIEQGGRPGAVNLILKKTIELFLLF
jgi:hypothetical protein